MRRPRLQKCCAGVCNCDGLVVVECIGDTAVPAVGGEAGLDPRQPALIPAACMKAATPNSTAVTSHLPTAGGETCVVDTWT